MTPISIDGVPEGIEVVRWGRPVEGDYVLYDSHGMGDDPAIFKGSANHGGGLIVRPAHGYEFVFDKSHGVFRVTREFSPKKISFTVTVTNTREQMLAARGIKAMCADMNLPLTGRRPK